MVDAYAVRTNKVPCGAMRGFGIPQIAFADETATGHRLKSSVGLEETLVRAKEASNWGKNLRKESNFR
jgi:CO/xanthine dehydrogenase Mo-binding subunit